MFFVLYQKTLEEKGKETIRFIMLNDVCKVPSNLYLIEVVLGKTSPVGLSVHSFTVGLRSGRVRCLL